MHARIACGACRFAATPRGYDLETVWQGSLHTVMTERYGKRDIEFSTARNIPHAYPSKTRARNRPSAFRLYFSVCANHVTTPEI